MLIAYSDLSVQPVTLHDQIAAEPDVLTVDYFDAEVATPTLAQLQQYEIVVATSNSVFFDPVAMGDVLADYADTGGVVVGLNFDWFDLGDVSHTFSCRRCLTATVVTQATWRVGLEPAPY